METFGSWVKLRSQGQALQKSGSFHGSSQHWWFGGWCVLELSKAMLHRAVPAESRLCQEKSCIRVLQLPQGTVATKPFRNTAIFGYNISPWENCAFQLKVNIFKSKLMLFANKRVKNLC